MRLGADWAKENLPEKIRERFRLPVRVHSRPVIMSGNEALALGALAGGCKFACGYPMTPGTGILAVLANEGPSVGLVFEQARITSYNVCYTKLLRWSSATGSRF